MPPAERMALAARTFLVASGRQAWIVFFFSTGGLGHWWTFPGVPLLQDITAGVMGSTPPLGDDQLPGWPGASFYSPSKNDSRFTNQTRSEGGCRGNNRGVLQKPRWAI